MTSRTPKRSTAAEQLFRDAAKTARFEIGLSREPASVSLQGDADLAKDVRMMVPIFFDVARGRLKVWAVIGWSTAPITASYEVLPKTTVKVEAGHRTYSAAVPIMLETYVTRLLDRAEMRALCNRHQDPSLLAKALAG